MSKSRNYSKEFKQEAVRKAVESSLPLYEVSRELNVDLPTLCRWVAAERSLHEGRRTVEIEMELLHEQARALKQENDRMRQEYECRRKQQIYADSKARWK